jgi:hypothetical protein
MSDCPDRHLIEALVEHWLKTDIATGTIKNRMSAIRWWARKVNKQNVVARSNYHYGIRRKGKQTMRPD